VALPTAQGSWKVCRVEKARMKKDEISICSRYVCRAQRHHPTRQILPNRPGSMFISRRGLVDSSRLSNNNAAPGRVVRVPSRRRTTAWSGLAGEWPLFEVAWASRSSARFDGYYDFYEVLQAMLFSISVSLPRWLSSCAV